MIRVFIGMMLGSGITITMLALMAVASDSDDRMEEMMWRDIDGSDRDNGQDNDDSLTEDKSEG